MLEYIRSGFLCAQFFTLQVIARYKVPREILVVVKYINSSCRYMTFDEDVSGMQEDAVSRFSYEVPKLEQDWQAWGMAAWVHPALMEAIYRGCVSAS